MGDGPYAEPKTVESPGECDFYHSMELPGIGPVEGQWDLREGFLDYLGHVDLQGKRVLEFGPASGFLTVQMEKLGAEVVAVDLSPDLEWDVVPLAREDTSGYLADHMRHIGRINNSWWLTRAAFGGRSKLVHSSVYDVPDAVGRFDVAVFGSILLHLRDPFRALQEGCRRIRETVIVSDLRQNEGWLRRILRALPLPGFLGREIFRPTVEFLPTPRNPLESDTWWNVSPEAVVAMLGVLGFERTEVSFHQQLAGGAPRRLFTVVGRRTVPLP